MASEKNNQFMDDIIAGNRGYKVFERAVGNRQEAVRHYVARMTERFGTPEHDEPCIECGSRQATSRQWIWRISIPLTAKEHAKGATHSAFVMAVAGVISLIPGAYLIVKLIPGLRDVLTITYGDESEVLHTYHSVCEPCMKQVRSADGTGRTLAIFTWIVFGFYMTLCGMWAPIAALYVLISLVTWKFEKPLDLFLAGGYAVVTVVIAGFLIWLARFLKGVKAPKAIRRMSNYRVNLRGHGTDPDSAG